MAIEDPKSPGSEAENLSAEKSGQNASDSETISATVGSQLDVKTDPEEEAAAALATDASDLAPPPRQEYVKGFKLFLLLAAIIVAYFLMMLDQTILATVIDDASFNGVN